MWKEGTECVPHPADWRPLRELSQEDLDQALGESHDSATKIEEQHEGKPKGASLVSGIPTGCELDVETQSNLDEFEMDLEAPSDYFSDDDEPFRAPVQLEEEEVEDRFIQTSLTMPASSYRQDREFEEGQL